MQKLKEWGSIAFSTYSRLKSTVSTKVKYSLRSDCVLCGDVIAQYHSSESQDNSSAGLCVTCQAKLRLNLCCCDLCALPLNEALTILDTEVNTQYCGNCQNSRPPWNKAIASFLYEYPMDRLLIALKYKNRVDLSVVLANLMASDLRCSYGFNDKDSQPLKPDCLIPVPLHPLREFVRGYNQANLLAVELGRHLDIPVRTDIVRRSRHTPMQSSLSKDERKKNLHKAFLVANRTVLPEYIVIVDDVMTTGSTVSVITSALLKAGVKRVDVWCCARAE